MSGPNPNQMKLNLWGGARHLQFLKAPQVILMQNWLENHCSTSSEYWLLFQRERHDYLCQLFSTASVDWKDLSTLVTVLNMAFFHAYLEALAYSHMLIEVLLGSEDPNELSYQRSFCTLHNRYFSKKQQSQFKQILLKLYRLWPAGTEE